MGNRLPRVLSGSTVSGTHAVVVSEVLAGARDLHEQGVIERLFQQFRIEHVNEADSALSIELLRRYRLRHGVGWLDCLVAATCLRLSLSVATLNDKHFSAFEELRVIRPY